MNSHTTVPLRPPHDYSYHPGTDSNAHTYLQYGAHPGVVPSHFSPAIPLPLVTVLQSRIAVLETELKYSQAGEHLFQAANQCLLEVLASRYKTHEHMRECCTQDISELKTQLRTAKLKNYRVKKKKSIRKALLGKILATTAPKTNGRGESLQRQPSSHTKSNSNTLVSCSTTTDLLDDLIPSEIIERYPVASSFHTCDYWSTPPQALSSQSSCFSKNISEPIETEAQTHQFEIFTIAVNDPRSEHHFRIQGVGADPKHDPSTQSSSAKGSISYTGKPEYVHYFSKPVVQAHNGQTIKIKEKTLPSFQSEDEGGASPPISSLLSSRAICSSRPMINDMYDLTDAEYDCDFKSRSIKKDHDGLSQCWNLTVQNPPNITNTKPAVVPTGLNICTEASARDLPTSGRRSIVSRRDLRDTVFECFTTEPTHINSWDATKPFATLIERKTAIHINRGTAGTEDRLFPDFFRFGVRYVPMHGEPEALRTVLLDNLPNGISTTDILKKVRGGLIISAKLMNTISITGSMSAMITFLYASSAFEYVKFIQQHPLTFYDQTARIEHISTPTWPMSIALRKAIYTYKHTRCLEIHDFPYYIAKKSLKRDLRVCNDLDLDMIESLELDGKATLCIRFSAIQYAGQGFSILSSYHTYRNLKVHFGPDPCALPLETLLEEVNCTEVPNPVVPKETDKIVVPVQAYKVKGIEGCELKNILSTDEAGYNWYNEIVDTSVFAAASIPHATCLKSTETDDYLIEVPGFGFEKREVVKQEENCDKAEKKGRGLMASRYASL
ncbi:MAG: hypothetical protein M1827_006893 [Pycnora praestabilis]|nr:MAG: hypothetical protein M1827_006893 [Pycnora praestabilis]